MLRWLPILFKNLITSHPPNITYLPSPLIRLIHHVWQKAGSQVIWRLDHHGERGSNHHRCCVLLKTIFQRFTCPHHLLTTPWWSRRILQTTTHRTTRTHSILGLSQTIIRLPIPINLRLPRSPITERKGIAIHHESIDSAGLLKSMFPGYLSHVALVSSSSSSTHDFVITHPHHIFIILLLIPNTIYPITLLCFT